jgi:hypothetical protein
MAQQVKVLAMQAFWPEVNHWSPGKGRRKESIPQSYPLTCTCALRHAYPPHIIPTHVNEKHNLKHFKRMPRRSQYHITSCVLYALHDFSLYITKIGFLWCGLQPHSAYSAVTVTRCYSFDWLLSVSIVSARFVHVLRGNLAFLVSSYTVFSFVHIPCFTCSCADRFLGFL